MLYFEKLRHFVARILDKGRRVRVWISSIFKRSEPVKYHRRHCHYHSTRGFPLSEYYSATFQQCSISFHDPYEMKNELYSSLLEKFKNIAQRISSKGISYYEEVHESVILYFDIIYNKEISVTSVENLHRLPYLDLSCARQGSSQDIKIMDFIPMRYSFNEYRAGKVSLFEYARVLAEFGNLICFKSHPEWGMIFVMELILLVLKYPSKKAKDLLCLENFLREESLVPEILEMEKEAEEIKEYTDREKKLAEKLIDELKKHGICFSQKKSDAQDFIGAAIKYYDKIFRWKHQWNEKGFTHPDFIECSSWEEVKSIWKDFKGKKAVISKQAESSCDCLKQPPVEVLDQMKKYQKFTTDRITIKKRFKSLRDVKKISPYSKTID